MMASRRLMKEPEEICKCGMKNFWLIVPDNPPYDKGAFRIEINFPAEYPFKPQKITFKTKIYHPIISAENWKPATLTNQVIQSLIAPEHPLWAGLAEEYS
ncbi:unnamed protein product [Nyctereutes procyonoides]|uniref:(raccoon dog) hypothetical protein n=1 Tax=Nyctereutes procyonoides TaxID=34880 RepID=A0A811ZGT7_NYCPR|nr:unnamed protein product [Nyctereutes procyonoides]